ncbi:MAG: IclR family transcriptional regulator [Hyphomicrobiales bacterium]|nr:MAG: IclR family transcriptional regulator [Hyphomicrobiales bacterium]
MGRKRTDALAHDDLASSRPALETEVIQVVARAFDIMRCFNGHNARLGNLEIANKCNLPRSTVSRLTQTLTRMGQLVYLPQDQKYRLGPGAIAMSTTILHGMHFRSLVRAKLQEFAERIPGTLGFVVPDRFDMVYLECARTYNAIGLNSTVGTRISIARTAAGLAYAVALDDTACESLLREMARENPKDARELRSQISPNREFFQKHGYVVSHGRWNPHITGCSIPMWSEQYRTFLVITFGVLSTMYDQKRLHKELAPQLLDVAAAISRMSDSVDGELLVTRRIAQAWPTINQTETTNRGIVA